MMRRTTVLAFGGQELEPIDILVGIPQGSLISPIPFLFYNMELLEICNPLETPVHGMGFVDDVNLIAYSHMAEANCANLQRVHD
jgi:hypothetical protein